MSRLPWRALAKGRELPAVAFQLSPGWVKEYIAAVEDGAIEAVGPRVVPSMAVAALALRALLESVELPAGTIHLGQELAFLGSVAAGQKLTARAKVASSGQRAGWSLVTFDLQVEKEGGEAVMTGRATATAPLPDNQ